MLLITSLNLFNISNNFWKDSLGSSIHRSMLSENPNSFTFSFSSLIALASIYSIVLNICGRTNILVLVPDTQGETFKSFTIKCDVNCGFFTDILHGVEEAPSYPKTVECFYQENVSDFVKCFSASINCLLPYWWSTKMIDFNQSLMNKWLRLIRPPISGIYTLGHGM